MQEVTLLHTKLDKLLKKYSALQTEKQTLLKTIREQSDQLQVLQKKIVRLEEKSATAKTADAISGKEDKAAVRKQLNALIKDIDKLLATLND